MRTSATLLPIVLASATLHALPEPLFEHPGGREPMRTAVSFHTEDYPALARVVDRALSGRRVGGMSGKTLSLWVSAPLKPGVAYSVARISALPGAGLWDDGSGWLLDLLPEGNGHRLVFRKHKNWPAHPGSHCLSAPFPPTPNRWVHVALSIDEVRRGHPSGVPCRGTLAVNGQTFPGSFWNDMDMARCGALRLGAPGVGIGPVQLYDAPLGGELTPEALRHRAVRSATPPTPRPEPTWRCAFDGSLEVTGAFKQSHFRTANGAPPTVGAAGLTPTPNGQGATQSLWQTGCYAAGEAFTLVAVGKASPEPGDVLTCFGVGTVDTQGFWLETGREGTLLLRTAMPGRSEETLTVPLPDAGAVFHCYALRYDAGELSLWVDGRRLGALAIRPAATPTDDRMPHIADFRRLTVRRFQLGKRLGPYPPSRGAFVIDDLSFYGRALSGDELARLAHAFTLTGATPRAATPAPTSAPALTLPALPGARPLPAADELKAAERLLDELLEGGQPKVADLLTYLRDAAGDPARLALLRRLGDTLMSERRFDDAMRVMEGQARAFPGAVTAEALTAWLREALRATAVRSPETALRHAIAALDFAEAQALPKAIRDTLLLTGRIDRHLSKAKTHPEWQTRAKAAERLAARLEAVETLRLKAKGSDPAANRALADALAQAGQWGEETLGAYIASDHPALARLAGEEATAEDSAQAALALGDGWWAQADACEKGVPSLAEAFRRHAAIFYRKGLPAVSGLRARLLRKRIEASP